MNWCIRYIFFIVLYGHVIVLGSVGTLDNTFGTSGKVTTPIGSSASNIGSACAIQPDNKIIAVGYANPGFAVARYTEQGILDTTFNSAGSTPGVVVTTNFGNSNDIALPTGVAIQSDGKIVVCGYVRPNGGATSTAVYAIVRYTAAGLLDTTFNSAGGIPGIVTTSISGGSIQRAHAITIDKNGNIILTGRINNSSGQQFIVLRYTSSGILDITFNTTGYVITTVSGGSSQVALGINVDNSGKIVICGQATVSTVQQFALLRYTSSGVLDTTFNTTGYVTTTISGGSSQIALGLILDNNNNILICGQAVVSSVQSAVLLKYSSTGVLDTSFGTSGSTVTAIGTNTAASGVRIQLNGYILISGRNDSAIFIARYTSLGILDTTFNSPTGYNTVALSSPGSAGIILQPNNEIVMTGLASGSLTTARLIGDAAPQGCMNVTYNSTGATPGYISYPTDSTAANKPQVKALQALSDNTVYVLTEDLATATKSQLVQLNSDGTTNLDPVTISQVGGIDVIVDSEQRALAIGTSGGNGWLRRSTTSTSLAADTTFGTSGIVVETTNSSSFRRVAEQKAGRIVVIGQSDITTRATLIAYNESGVLANSSQSLCAGFGRVVSGDPQGFITFDNVTYYDVLIDTNDGIYVAYKGTTSNIKIIKFLANGSGNDNTFGTSGSVDTGWAIGSYGEPALSFDTSGNIVIAAINSSTRDIAVKRYTPTSTTTTTGSILQTTSVLTTPILTKLQCDTDNRLIFNGYDQNVFFIARCTAGTLGTVDTTFAPNSSTPGILKTMYNDNNPTDATTPTRVNNSLCISPNGAILFGGYENISSSSTISVVGNVVGDTTPYSQVARYPGATLTGVIDVNFGNDGTLALADAPASLPAGSAQAVYVLANNKILVADANGTDTVLGQLTSSYVLDTASFGATTGKITLSGLVNPKNIMIDTTENIYVVGDNGSHMMLFKMTSTGVLLWSITSDNLTTGNVVLQQASGRIIVTGYNGTSGVIAGYNCITGAIDTTFATSGYYTTGVAAQVAAAAITSVDKIIFVYRNGSGNGIVNRLIPSGVTDGTFNFGTALTSVSPDISSQAQIKLQQDSSGKIVVAARNSSGNFIARRYLATGADDVSTLTITLNDPLTSFLNDILALSNGTTLIAGSNSTGSTLEMAYLNAAFALDTNFSYGQGILQTAVSPMKNFYAIDVTSDQGILVAGASITPNPYFTQIYNNAVVTKVNQNSLALGTQGTIDTTFATSGYLSLIGTATATAVPQVILPASTGGDQYVAFHDGTSAASTVARYTNANILDGTYHTTGVAVDSAAGVYSMSFLANGGLLLAGTAAAGWVEQYTTAGILDVTFNAAGSTVAPYVSATPGILSIPSCTVATVAVQQSLGRIVVAGQMTGVNGALFGITNTGTVDTTFGTAGIYDCGIATTMYAMMTDQYDRLIIAYKNGTAIDLARLTSAGQLDTTFGTSGIIAGAITGIADDVTQVRVAIDLAGNIVVAAHISTPAIAFRAYANTTGTSAAYAQLSLPSLVTPVLTGVIATADGKLLISGNSTTSTYQMWVARITSGGALDTTTFNSGATAGPVAGIMQFAPGAAAMPTARQLTSIAIYGDGEISLVGTEASSTSTANNPFMSRAYNTPYTTQQPIDLTAKPDGTNDVTLGASTTSTTDLGITFFASSGANAASAQIARAIALQNNNNIVVAIDGGAAAGTPTPSQIFLTKFDIDGVVVSGFGTAGQATVLSAYNNQYVQDMVTFTTVAGVNKAILAGYVTNTTLGSTSSLLLQYNLDTPALDTTFGGFNGNPQGIAFGDGKQINSVVQQTSGRIIAAGISKDTLGLLLGYTSAGKLDNSFGNDGYVTVAGSTALFTHAVDSLNRVVVAYTDQFMQVNVARFLADGSGLDTSFNSTGIINTLSVAYSISSMRIALDSSNNVYVAMVADTRASITIFSYAALNGAVLYTPLTTTLGDTLTAFTIGQLIVDANGQAVIVGSDTNGASADQVVVIRVYNNSGALALDPTFNPSPNNNPGNATGYLKYAVVSGSTVQTAQDALIHPDGRLLIVGSEN